MSRGLLLGLLALAGCTPARVDPPALPRVELGAAYDPATTGTLQGQVHWGGPLPVFGRASGVVPDGDDYRLRGVANPFATAVDPATSGLRNVLVTLKVVNPERSRPWDHPPVTLTMADFNYRLSQGDGAVTGPGIVRVGDGVTFVSRDPELHVVRARGAAFFSLTLPSPNQPRSRRFDKPGVVELTSGAGYFWDAVDLCVSDHPYVAVTDAQGRYEMPQVPDGAYTLTMRLRNPTVVRVERDPETGLPFRHFYAAPVVKSFPVTVGRGAIATQGWVADASLFGETR